MVTRDCWHGTRMAARHESAPRGAIAPGRVTKISPRKNRGRRECRAPDAPDSRVCRGSGRKHTRSSGHTGITRHSLRNGFNGVCRALPGDRACLSPSSNEYGLGRPVGLAKPPLDLTPASRRQDQTILPYAKASFVSAPSIAHRSFDLPCDHVARTTLPRPPHPVPYVRDDRDTPLNGNETARGIEVISVWRQQE